MQLTQWLQEQENFRGETIAAHVRWILLFTTLGLNLFSLMNDYYSRFVVQTLLLLACYGLYNLFVSFQLKQKEQSSIKLSYLSTSVDILLLSVHIYLNSRVGVLEIFLSASFFLYFIILLITALRFNIQLILYGLALTLVMINLIFIVSFSLQDQLLQEHIFRQIFRNVYIIAFAFFLLHIPRTIQRILNNQETFIEEIKKKDFFEEKDVLSYVKEYQLSKREKDVFLLLIKGLSYKGIAEKLKVSPETIKSHSKNIYKKTGVKGRYELQAHLKQEMVNLYKPPKLQ